MFMLNFNNNRLRMEKLRITSYIIWKNSENNTLNNVYIFFDLGLIILRKEMNHHSVFFVSVTSIIKTIDLLTSEVMVRSYLSHTLFQQLSHIAERFHGGWIF